MAQKDSSLVLSQDFTLEMLLVNVLDMVQAWVGDGDLKRIHFYQSIPLEVSHSSPLPVISGS